MSAGDGGGAADHGEEGGGVSRETARDIHGQKSPGSQLCPGHFSSYFISTSERLTVTPCET